MAQIKVLSPAGHSVVEWEPTQADTVESAKKEFDEIVRANYLVAEVKSPGKQEQATRFDPEAKGYVAYPPLAGG